MFRQNQNVMTTTKLREKHFNKHYSFVTTSMYNFMLRTKDIRFKFYISIKCNEMS